MHPAIARHQYNDTDYEQLIICPESKNKPNKDLKAGKTKFKSIIEIESNVLFMCTETKAATQICNLCHLETKANPKYY